MNKENLSREISRACGITQSLSKMVVDAFCESVTNALLRGEEVRLSGFGKFFAKYSAPSVLNTALTNKRYLLPARFTPKFVAADAFKARFKHNLGQK